jgi:trk system potassium uptake protein TrkA
MRQFAVIGIGRFGFSVAQTLTEQGFQVLAIDTCEECVEEIADIVTQAVQLDATDEKNLRTVGIADMDVVVVAIGVNQEASILTTLILKEMGVKHIVAKAISPLHGKVLKRIGADRVVFPEGDMGKRLARSLASPSILDNLELSSEYGIFEIIAPPGFIGKTFRELNIRAKYGLNVIAVKKQVADADIEGKAPTSSEQINISPLADDKIPPDGVLVVVGSNESVQRFRKKTKS